MKNNLARTHSATNIPVPEKKISVVQCPSCQTKFAVDSGLLGGVDIPRFHCSRCDNVFSMDRTILGLGTPSSQKLAPALTEQPHEEPKATVREFTPKAVEPKEILPSNIPDDQFTFDFQPNQNPEKDFKLFDNSQFDENDDYLSASGPDFGVSVIKGHDDHASDSLSPISDAELESQIFAGLSEQHSTTPSVQTSKPSIGLDSHFREDPSSAAVADEPMGYATLYRGQTPRDFQNDWSKDLASDDALPEPRREELAARPKNIPSLMPSRWGGCLTLATPIVAFLLLLGGVTIYCVTHPEEANAVVQSFFPSKETVSPGSVYVTNSKLKRIILDSGEAVSVISGKIVNQSENSFSDVQIEGIIFDKGGNLLSRKKISAGSSLGRSRIQSLSPEMIEDLQNSKAAKRFELKKDQEFEFTLAIPEEMSASATNPAFFSARVYSVKAQ